MKRPITLTLVLLATCQAAMAQYNLSWDQKKERTTDFQNGKLQVGIGVNLKVDLVRGELGYYRLSLAAGAGIPFGKGMYIFNEDNKRKRNNFMLSYTAELDIFRGGLGASSISNTTQDIFFELRQAFLTYAGFDEYHTSYNFTRPVIHFGSNSARALLDPFTTSVILGTTFVNSLNQKRSQRVGILSLGHGSFSAMYLNDGPPFNFNNYLLPYGDGYDRWWTGSGQVGFYHPFPNSIFTQLEFKFDKFTGLQPYAYELATALKLKHIPYHSKNVQLFNRQRLELSIGTSFGLGWTLNFYDNPKTDVQHRIHLKRFFSYHSTPLKPQGATGLFYTGIHQFKFN